MGDPWATGVGAVIVLTVGWVAVQEAWRRTFPERLHDADVLAVRPRCSHRCTDGPACAHRAPDGTCHRNEEDPS